MTTPTPSMNPNERMALLLGWERGMAMRFHEEAEYWSKPGTRFWGWECPDFTTWQMFPEMQECVRGLDALTRGMLDAEMITVGWQHITPTILRDAILEVSDGS